MSGIQLVDGDLRICRHDVIIKFFVVDVFFLSHLVTGPSFMSISWLVLELWQFSFIKDWPVIRESEIPPSELCPISGDWGKLGMPNLAQISNKKLLNAAKCQSYTVSELLRENQHPPPRLWLRSTYQGVSAVGERCQLKGSPY